MYKKQECVAMLLAGGQGSRLYALTKNVAKPAVPYGGKYRLIDFPLSNCINSGYKKIYLLTQFNSASLHLHITNSYNFDRFSGGFVEILAAEQTLEHSGWYEGTADAVRKNFIHFKSQRPTHYIILSGDQLYKMDLKAFMNEHIRSGAEITIATTAVNRHDASGFGIMKIDAENRVKEFMEKPKPTMNIDDGKIPAEARGSLPAEKEYLASMGIYIFNADTMEEVLSGENEKYTDFGKEILPLAIGKKKISSYVFDGYWEDIGTIKSFYDANIALTDTRISYLLKDADPDDYDISYSNNINAGTASMTITGCGKFSGTVTKTFFIIFTLFDAAWGIIGAYTGKHPNGAFVIIYTVSSYIFHLLALLSSFAISIYSTHYLKPKPKMNVFIWIMRMIIIVVQLTLLIQNIWTGTFFTVDSEGLYHAGFLRAPAFLLQFLQ